MSFLGGVTLFAYAFTFLVALAVTFVLTPVVKNFAIRIGAVDKPDARKVHHGLVLPARRPCDLRGLHGLCDHDDRFYV